MTRFYSPSGVNQPQLQFRPQLEFPPRVVMLYNGVTNLIIENLDRLTKETISPNLHSGVELDLMKRRCEDEKILEAVHNAWSDHTDSVKKVSHIVKPMVCLSLPESCHYSECVFYLGYPCETCQPSWDCRLGAQSIRPAFPLSPNKGSRHRCYPGSPPHRAQRSYN